jgi:hypothetical protein
MDINIYSHIIIIYLVWYISCHMSMYHYMLVLLSQNERVTIFTNYKYVSFRWPYSYQHM